MHDGQMHTVAKTAPNFGPLKEALESQRWDDVPGLLTVRQAVAAWSSGDFVATETGGVSYKGTVLPSALAKRILKMVGKGDEPTAAMRFWERLTLNPEQRSREQLFDFLDQHAGIPLRPDGRFLAYKGVRDNFRDAHSGNIDNSPGQTVRMDRGLISSDPSSACSRGLHVGALAYAGSFSSKCIVVMVDPAHVVCVPNDCSQRKIRVCEYKVLGLHGGELLTNTVEAEEPAVDTQAIIDALPTDRGGKTTETGDAAPAAEGDVGAQLPLVGTDWDAFNDLDSLDLLKLRIMPLRAYARFNLLIIGASKMRGGKAVLVPAIIKARCYNDPADKPEHLR
jgi:hypothetical protein